MWLLIHTGIKVNPYWLKGLQNLSIMGNLLGPEQDIDHLNNIISICILWPLSILFLLKIQIRYATEGLIG